MYTDRYRKTWTWKEFWKRMSSSTSASASGFSRQGKLKFTSMLLLLIQKNKQELKQQKQCQVKYKSSLSSPYAEWDLWMCIWVYYMPHFRESHKEVTNKNHVTNGGLCAVTCWKKQNSIKSRLGSTEHMVEDDKQQFQSRDILFFSFVSFYVKRHRNDWHYSGTCITDFILYPFQNWLNKKLKLRTTDLDYLLKFLW